MYDKVKYLCCGVNSVVMEFADEINKDVNSKIRNIVDQIDSAKLDYIIDVLPTYRSLLITYDVNKVLFEDVVEQLKKYENSDVKALSEMVRLIKIPTVYGKEYGVDLPFVASHNGISEEEVIKIHTGTDYLVYMLGFMPGFTYLGGMSEKIATPRLSSPREKIEAGSVGIAGTQTGMYPSVSPGGWQIIGRTPLILFDSKKEPPVFVNSGDYIRYVQIDEKEFYDIRSRVQKGEYEIEILEVKRSELNE